MIFSEDSLGSLESKYSLERLPFNSWAIRHHKKYMCSDCSTCLASHGAFTDMLWCLPSVFWGHYKKGILWGLFRTSCKSHCWHKPSVPPYKRHFRQNLFQRKFSLPWGISVVSPLHNESYITHHVDFLPPALIFTSIFKNFRTKFHLEYSNNFIFSISTRFVNSLSDTFFVLFQILLHLSEVTLGHLCHWSC